MDTPSPLTVVCDLSALADSDLGTVDALARMALVASRLDCRIQLRDASSELRELLALVGLSDIMPCVAPLAVEVRR